MKRTGLFLIILAMVIGISSISYGQDISGVYIGKLIIEEKGEEDEGDVEIIMMQSGKNITGTLRVNSGTVNIRSGITDNGKFIITVADRFTSAQNLPVRVLYRIEGQVEKKKMEGKFLFEMKGYRRVGRGMESSASFFKSSREGIIIAEKEL